MWSDKYDDETSAPGQPRKLLGRDPLLWSAVAGSLLAGAVAFGLGIDAGAAAAIHGLLVAVIAVWATRPLTPGVLAGVLSAGIALLAAYGVHVSEEQVVLLHAIVINAFAWWTRAQVRPQDTLVSRS